MAFEDYKTKQSVVIVYTGEGKGKTTASLGLLVRALGTGWNVAFAQFIKHWDVGEHNFLKRLEESFPGQLSFYKGGEGFYKAGEMSAKGVSERQHREAAEKTFEYALKCATEGQFDLVVCDEINNAVHDGLIEQDKVEEIMKAKHDRTSLCLTGRDFPSALLPLADIVTEMRKVKHHFDEKYLANKGIDY